MNRSGTWKNHFAGDLAYKSFLPAPLPPNPPISLGADGLKLLIQANKELAFFEGIASKIPSLPLFVSMYVRKEALLSSQIEGTQATLEDLFDPNVEENVNADVSEVINYIKATEYAMKRLKDLPLCNRLIKETHSVLMEGVRGKDKSPGEFRTSQNWIGGTGSTLKNARFIPPSPDMLVGCMSDLEKYLHADDDTDPLVKAGLIHYQFETIHPFLDGNGRIGRLLISLYLVEAGVLSTPSLYISYFLKRNRLEYYDRMSEVRIKGNYEQWVMFFLQALSESARDAVQTTERLSDLHDKNREILEKIPRNANLLTLFSYLEQHPTIEISKTADSLGLAYNTVSKAVDKMMDLGILRINEKPVKAGRTTKSRTFSYTQYLDILSEGT